MENRFNRSVSVSMSGIGLLVGLIWFENSEGIEPELKATYLEYSGGKVTESVEQAINVLVGGWDRLFATDTRMCVVCNLQKEDNDLFDFIANAEEPEQAFISRYVLEYEGGKIAKQRYDMRRLEELKSLRPIPAGG